MNDEPTPYDDVPYVSHPYPQTHVNRLATVATLFGMQPQVIHNCRVLELGCAGGGNLIPMALTLPDSRFVGIDLSGRQIEEAQATSKQLGLTNVELSCRSILDVTSELGPFDYIVCHGVWSWVPSAVREKILSICQEHLSPQGVAYISYNVYPGWHMRGTVRDMMLYHARKFATPQERAGHARALLDFLVRSVPTSANAYSLLLKNEMELLRGMDDSYLLHEHLERVNEPIYFHQFEEQAAVKNLQFLGEADVATMLTAGMPADVETILSYLTTNLVEREQYLDFLRNRMFRQTLLCRSGLPINRRPEFERMRRLYFASAVVAPPGEHDVTSNEEMAFKSPQGVAKTTDPAMKTALSLLARKWPEALGLEALVAQVQSRLYEDAAVDAATRLRGAEALSKNLLDCYVRRFVEIFVEPPACKAVPGDRPAASPLARLQAVSGNLVTNLNHHSVKVDEIARNVLRLCDGTRNREALLAELGALVHRSVVVIGDATGAAPDPSRAKLMLAESLTHALADLTRKAVLIG